MSSLTINPKWNSEINQVENGEPITGGTLGNANLASRQLGENIFYLKQKVENDLATKANKADVYTKTETDTNFAKKSTTLNGYGIIDAYTKTQVDNLVDSKTGDLTTLKTTDKTQLVKSINEVYDSTKGVVELYNKNVEAGAGENGWTDQFVALSNGRTQADKNSDFVSVKDYGAIGDGTLHPLSERYNTLADAQKKYPHARSLNDSIDWAALQQAVNNVMLAKRAIYLNDFNLHFGDKTLEIKQPIVMFGASNLGVGSALINYSGSDVAIRLKKDNFDSGDYSKWIYGASLSNFGIRGLGGNAKKAFELWGCSECCFDKITVGGTTQSKFNTAFELNRCSINTFKDIVGSYNNVMYDFRVDPASRYRPNSASFIIGGDYYDNNTMFKCNSISGLYINSAWIESCDTIFDFDDATNEFECDNIFFDTNYVLMNLTTSDKILKINNGVDKKSRIIGMQLTDNVMRYTEATTNTVVPIDIKSFESSSGYNIFDIKVADNVYYGKAAALIDANTSRITLNLRNNRNLNASNHQKQQSREDRF
jgi:hypothetical protein